MNRAPRLMVIVIFVKGPESGYGSELENVAKCRPEQYAKRRQPDGVDHRAELIFFIKFV